MSNEFLLKKTAFVNLDNVNFQEGGKVHNWRNYVPFELQSAWEELTLRERQIIFVMACEQADKEEWD